MSLPFSSSITRPQCVCAKTHISLLPPTVNLVSSGVSAPYVCSSPALSQFKATLL